MSKPVKIGLTGGIGSGKTTVATIFELLHVPVFYADAASKELYQTDEGLKADMIDHFGDQIYHEGKLNKSLLASIVFNDENQLAALNALVHPRTIKAAEEWMERQTAPYVVKEAALIFEGGSAAGLDYVIGVRAPKHLRIKRVMDRENIPREEVLTRIQRQIDEEIKMRLCDFVIENDEQKPVIPQVLSLHERFLSLANERKIRLQ